MSSIPQLITYLQRCYQADNRELSLFNFFNSKVQLRLMLSEASLAEGKHVWQPVPTDWGATATKKLAVYGKEKTLMLGVFFVVGETEVAGEGQRVCAPMFLHSLELIHEEGVYYVRFSAEGFLINPAVVRVLQTEARTELTVILQRTIDQKTHFDFETYDRLEKALALHCLNLDLPEEIALDDLLSEEALRKSKPPQPTRLRLIPAIGVGLVDKQNAARELINELEELAQATLFSPPLRELLGRKTGAGRQTRAVRPFAPADFNRAQLGILNNLFDHTTNVVIGPPGSGKSFTIAGIAADCIARGKTVLIAAQTDQAVDVIYQKIREDLGLEGMAIRGGSREYVKELKSRIEGFALGMNAPRYSSRELRDIRQKVKTIDQTIRRMEDLINRREEVERALGDWLTVPGSMNWRNQFQFWRRKRQWRRIAHLPELVARLDDNLEQRKTLLRRLVEIAFYHRLAKTMDRYWSDFRLFLQAVKARTGNKKENLFREASIDKIIQAVPVWLVNCNDVGRILPLQRELFDLVVIDEATQCNLASCLPILQRGKRALIVGDPKQLRHVSFLSQELQRSIAGKYQVSELEVERLDFRKVSLMDLVIDQAGSARQVHFLDEHYRSLPDIIRFSNERFYANALKVMSETPVTNAQRNVFLHFCAGKRYKRGYNKVEADLIIEQLTALIASEEHLDVTLKKTVGVLSPFREQADYLQAAIDRHFSLVQIEAHRIQVGTPYHFQGEERDVMFLSFAVDADTHPSSLLYLNREDVFNVSITRARMEQRVFVSWPPDRMNGMGGLFFDYLAHLQNGPKTAVHSAPVRLKDAFLEEVLRFVSENAQAETHPNYAIGNQAIDLVVVVDGRTSCIDLVGYPGTYGAALPVDRYRQLSRMGVAVFPLAYSMWYWNREEAQQKLLRWITKNEK